MPLRLLALATLLFYSGCAIKIGRRVGEGVLVEAAGQGRSPGVEGVLESVTEKQLLAELGHQIGSSLASGATDITPEQRIHLETVIDGLIAVALKKAGKGLREDVSPELRAMVRRDIVQTLSEGLRGELGESLEQTVDRVVTRTVLSLRQGLEDTETQLIMADFVRESIYMAMREGQGYTPGVGETLQNTLTENMLTPLETSVDSIAATVAAKVDEQTEKTEKTLQAVISGLILILGVFVIMYMVTRRQLRRQEQQAMFAKRAVRSAQAALGALDDSTQEALGGRVDEFKQLISDFEKTEDPNETNRSDEYYRK